MSKKITKLAIYALALTLLGYTAFRTVHLIGLTLPAGQQNVAFLALLAFDGGLLAWSWFFVQGAAGSWQRGISGVMIAVSLLGVIVAYMGDTLLTTGQKGLTAELSPQAVQAVVLAMGVIIAANIAAAVGIHLTDPETLRAMAEEAARDAIEDESLKQIQAAAPSLAKELAPELAADWKTDIRARYRAGLRYANPAADKAPAIVASPNGKAPQLAGSDPKDRRGTV